MDWLQKIFRHSPAQGASGKYPAGQTPAGGTSLFSAPSADEPEPVHAPLPAAEPLPMEKPTPQEDEPGFRRVELSNGGYAEIVRGDRGDDIHEYDKDGHLVKTVWAIRPAASYERQDSEVNIAKSAAEYRSFVQLIQQERARSSLHLSIDTGMIDAVIRGWENETDDDSPVLADARFQTLLSHAKAFQRTDLDGLSYLNSLLHIDGIDMRNHLAEIRRNLTIIRSVDLKQLAQHVQNYLPENALSGSEIQICPMIGIAGLALNDFIVIDPSPCPWFPADGSDREAYLSTFILPVLQHELHHVGYKRLHPVRNSAALKTHGELAADYALQFQMEGVAKLCEQCWSGGTLDASEYQKLCGSFSQHYDRILEWLRTPAHPIGQKDWDAYDALWSGDKPVYWLGRSICVLLIQRGMIHTVSDCVQMEPLKMMQMAADCIKPHTCI